MTRKKKPAEELRALIADAGLSQRAAAVELGVSTRCVEQWLAADGLHPPPMMAILAMRWIVDNATAEVS